LHTIALLGFCVAQSGVCDSDVDEDDPSFDSEVDSDEDEDELSVLESGI